MNRSTSLDRVTSALAHLHSQSEFHGPAARNETTPPPQCTVAIAREAGTQGAVLARIVGEQLEWPVFDRELLDIIANEMHLRVRDLEDIDERPVSWFLESVEAFTSDHFVSENAFVKYLARAILTLGRHGGCVIVGRAAAHILPPDTTLRVRLVAPLKTRIDTIRQKLDLTAKEAEEKIKRTDQERSQFVEQHFHRNPNDPANYDLVLNTARFAPLACAGLVIAALRALQAHLSGHLVERMS
jgi:cytidylate kinase